MGKSEIAPFGAAELPNLRGRWDPKLSRSVQGYRMLQDSGSVQGYRMLQDSGLRSLELQYGPKDSFFQAGADHCGRL